MKQPFVIALAMLLLAACNDPEKQADELGTEAIPIASVANPADCAKVTLDIAPERFAEGRQNFAVGTQARTRLD